MTQASGEMRCKWCDEPIWLKHDGRYGSCWIAVAKDGWCARGANGHEPAAVPESAIEPEPQGWNGSPWGTCPICGFTRIADGWLRCPQCNVSLPAASSAIEVAPQQGENMRPAYANECHCGEYGGSDCHCSPRPSVAPGEAQREQRPCTCGHIKQVHRDGACQALDPCDCTKFAVPSEVAPSREQRLEDALRNLHTAVWKNCGKVRLLKMRAELEAADALLEEK